MSNDRCAQNFAVFAAPNRQSARLGRFSDYARRFVGASLLGVVIAQPTAVFGQESQSEVPPAAVSADSAPTPTSVEAEFTVEQGEALIRQLGASKFERREQAMAEILRIGDPMVPLLRKAIDESKDAEQLLRAQSTLAQLTTGNFEATVAKFLSGRDDGSSFDGWLTVEATLSDTPAAREIFIQILRAHPGLVASLDGTTRDRTVAVDQAAQLIQTNMFQNQIFPTLADGVALLLPLVDPGVAISGGYEATLVSVLQKHMATLRRDASLWLPVSRLLDQWVLRSRIESRSDVLWYAMQWDLPASAQLGVKTLAETTDAETLQTAMQAISRFGTKEDAKTIEKFIDDERLAVTRLPVIVDNEPLQVTIGDCALAAVATLYQVPLVDIGMKQGELHGKVGFLVDSAGYLKSQAEDRKKAVIAVRSWIRGEATPVKPRS
jgi:hypothetical protein